MTRLGVNIDHVATLRNQRDEGYPNLARAAQISLENGAHQITIHLREDRRHIRDDDLKEVQKVTRKYQKLLNLEVGTDLEIAGIAGELAPDWVCIVPEKREEKTTEGGLDITRSEIYEKVIQVIEIIKEKSANSKISLFIEASMPIFEAVKKMNKTTKIDAVEIHTGDYAKAVLLEGSVDLHFEVFQQFKARYLQEDIGYHAGHGLTLESLRPLVDRGIFDEYNIGHWIISESIFSGIGPVVKEMSELLKQ